MRTTRSLANAVDVSCPACRRRWGQNAGRRWKGGRGPTASINFVTAHDGFTLGDLVAYNEKHNEANGEDNRCAPAGWLLVKEWGPGGPGASASLC